MTASRDALFQAVADRLGHRFDGELKVGGHYAAVIRHGGQVFVSGQIPRVGNDVMVTGRAGADASLAQARLGAEISAMRALALLKQSLGTLDRIEQLLRITVFVQCAEGFTQQSEVADAASDLLHEVLGDAGRHTRSSVGVYQLPKNAAVEIDLVAAAFD